MDVHETVAHLPGGFPKLFFPFNLSFNLLKFHLNSDRTSPQASLSKRGLVHNHSYDNEFYLQVNEISISYERDGHQDSL